MAVGERLKAAIFPHLEWLRNDVLESAAVHADFYAKTGDGLPWNTVEECEAASKAAKYVAREIADSIRAMKREVG